MNNFYVSAAFVFLLGFGIRFLYVRLNKGWLITLGMAVVTGIVWLWSTDGYVSSREGEVFLALWITILFAGVVLGETAVRLYKYFRKRKSNRKSPENISKGEPT